jgi:hypothetical protein
MCDIFLFLFLMHVGGLLFSPCSQVEQDLDGVFDNDFGLDDSDNGL